MSEWVDFSCAVCMSPLAEDGVCPNETCLTNKKHDGCQYDTFYVFEQDGQETTVWACCQNSVIDETCGYMSERHLCGNQYSGAVTATWPLLDRLNQEHYDYALQA